MLFFTMNLIASEMSLGNFNDLFGGLEDYLKPEESEFDSTEDDDDDSDDEEKVLKYCSLIIHAKSRPEKTRLKKLVNPSSIPTHPIDSLFFQRIVVT